ncbi:hypothetical protein, partial [Salmonella enterica]|uniref:hypothetical protein n=1 Tax=Salmonella enterica TaxID=28901 RepID=UPI0019D70670
IFSFLVISLPALPTRLAVDTVSGRTCRCVKSHQLIGVSFFLHQKKEAGLSGLLGKNEVND